MVAIIIIIISENGTGWLHRRRVRQRLDSCRGLFCTGQRISRVPSKCRFHDDTFFVLCPVFDFEPLVRIPREIQIQQMIC